MKVASNIQNIVPSNQATFCSKEGESMLAKVFRQILDQVIRENAIYKDGSYSLFASDLPYHDKKLLLSYLIPIDEYDEYIKDPHKERAAFLEYENDMQYLIDDRIDDIWHEDMKEMGRTLCHCNQTGEPYYR